MRDMAASLSEAHEQFLSRMKGMRALWAANSHGRGGERTKATRSADGVPPARPETGDDRSLALRAREQARHRLQV